MSRGRPIQVELVRERLEDGWTTARVAGCLGVTETAVRAALRRNGVAYVSPAVAKRAETLERIRDLHASGVRPEGIACHVEVTRGFVRLAIAEAEADVLRSEVARLQAEVDRLSKRERRAA